MLVSTLTLALGVALVAGLWFSALQFVSTVLGHLAHSPAQLYFATLCILMICLSYILGMLIWAMAQPEPELPRKHRGIPFHTLFHH